MSFLSDRLNTRVALLVVIPLPVITGYAIALGTANIGAGYFAMFLVGAGTFGPPSPTALLESTNV